MMQRIVLVLLFVVSVFGSDDELGIPYMERGEGKPDSVVKKTGLVVKVYLFYTKKSVREEKKAHTRKNKMMNSSNDYQSQLASNKKYNAIICFY